MDIYSIVNGVAIRSLTHDKEVKKLKKDLIELYLTPEEKALSELEKSMRV